MQDIRKPYTRSRSNADLSSRVERFENRAYEDDQYYEEAEEPVRIPVSRIRRSLAGMDMYPPKKESRHEEDLEYTDTPNRDRDHRGLRQAPVYRDPRTRYIKREGRLGTWAFISTVVVFAVGAGLLTYVFNSATVTIVPKTRDVNDFGRTLTFGQKGADSASIPFIVEKTVLKKSKTLPLSESRKVEAKAKGRIVVYNNFDGLPQKLIKNTRFESKKGKIYRINDSITIPGMKGGTPGSVEVDIYADSNGADYNIDATEFTIPGFKGTPREKGL